MGRPYISRPRLFLWLLGNTRLHVPLRARRAASILVVRRLALRLARIIEAREEVVPLAYTTRNAISPVPHTPRKSRINFGVRTPIEHTDRQPLQVPRVDRHELLERAVVVRGHIEHVHHLHAPLRHRDVVVQRRVHVRERAVVLDLLLLALAPCISYPARTSAFDPVP